MKFLKKTNVKNWLIFLGMLLLFLYIDYFVVAIYYTMGNDLHNLTLYDKLIILFSKYIILIMIFVFKDKKYLKEKWFDFIKNFKKYFVISFKYWFMGLLLMIISNNIINQFISGLGENESSVQTLITKMPVIAFILTTILAPFVEEMVFRKYLKDCINKKTLYMIVSGLIFGFIHTSINTNILEILLIIPYGAMGFMLAKTLYETDNIYPTVMMHMFHNALLTLLAIWGI